MALLLLCCAVVACCVSAAPAAHERSAADAWVMDAAAAQHAAPRRITPKSIFIAPSFSHASLPACAEGYRPDAMGRCVKVVRVDPAAQLDFLLRRLNAMYAAPAPAPPPPRTDAAASGPLQLSLSLGEAPAPPPPDVRGSGSSAEEVAVVLADVVKDTPAGADAPQTMLAVWNISKNTTSSADVAASVPSSAKGNATGFLSGLSLPRVEETIPIVMQTPPSTLVIQDPPGADAFSRPLSSEVDFDIPYYDYYQDHDAADSRCSDSPCKNSFAEINSRSPHAPQDAPVNASSDDVTGETTTEASATSSTAGDASENATRASAMDTDVTLQSDVGDDAVSEHESEVLSNKQAASPVGNVTEVDIAGDVNASRPNITRAVLPEIYEYVGSFETSAEVSVKHSAGKVNKSEEVVDNGTDVYSDVTPSDAPSTDVYFGETSSDVPSTDVYTGETSSDVPGTDVYTYETSSDAPNTDVYSGETTTNAPPTTEFLEVNATADAGANAGPETLPKKPSTLPDESSLIGTSMDPLSDLNAADGPDTTEQRSAARGSTRRPSSGAKSGRVRFPDAAETRVAFPDDGGGGGGGAPPPPPPPPPFWWLPVGWRLDHSRHHPVLLRFWRRYGGGRDAHFYQAYADG